MIRIFGVIRLKQTLSSTLKYFSICRARHCSTIYALSSGHGKCGVAVIRISGPEAGLALKQIGCFKTLPEPRKVFLRKLKNSVTKDVLDHGLVIWFPGPRSFTGEDCCELQVHGGLAVITAVLNTLSNMKNFRPAEPGEFTKRAFYAGKLNLTEVEGLGDLIHSETELQRKQALIQMEGALGEKYMEWRKTLLQCVAHIEAYIDFSEDQLLGDNILLETQRNITVLRDEIQKHLKNGRRGEILRDGVNTAILGAPNVGKSSLLNALSQRQAAIVSPIAGTTRDIVRSYIDISGFPVILADTAGLRKVSSDIIEEEGILRAKSCAKVSDLLILVIDSSELVLWCKSNLKSIESGLWDYIKMYVTSLGIENLFWHCDNINCLEDNNYVYKTEDITCKCLIILNKVDLLGSELDIETIFYKYGYLISFISCKTGFGMEKFLASMTELLKLICGNPSKENPNYSQARHRFCLVECLTSLTRFLSFSEGEIELAAHELRTATNSIGKITGHVSTEQILDIIFKDFCIGK